MEELYDQISRVLTWFEHPEEYPFGEEECKKDIAELMHNVLVKVQRRMLDTK